MESSVVGVVMLVHRVAYASMCVHGVHAMTCSTDWDAEGSACRFRLMTLQHVKLLAGKVSVLCFATAGGGHI